MTLEHLEEMAYTDKTAYAEIEERKEKPVNLVPPAGGGREDEGTRERGERGDSPVSQE